MTVNTRSTIALLSGICWLTITSTAEADPATLSLNRQVEEVASYLEGVMDTSKQATADPKAPNVRMTTCRITLTTQKTESSGEIIFLYQEQALSQNLTKPYRQRFLQLSPSPYSQSVRSLSFKPTNPSSWAGFCNKPIAERVVKPSDLGNPVCSVFLRRSNDAYKGNTPVDGCPANVRGAIRITNHIELNPIGMNTWDRGFNANGEQVWGARSESYQFRRLQSAGQ